MKRFIAIMALVVASVFGTAAQSVDKFDNYVGYQFVRVNPDVRTPTFRYDRTSDLHGFNVASTYFGNPTRPIGLTAELGANFDAANARAGLYTAMAGVTLKANRTGKLEPFIRGLAGVSVQRADSDNRVVPNKGDFGFAYAAGAGIDVRLTPNIKLRVIQADYLHTENYGSGQHNLRLGAGLVF